MKGYAACWIVASLLAGLLTIENASAFSPSSPRAVASKAVFQRTFRIVPSRHVLKSAEDDESSEGYAAKKSLEDKMASWEASEEEIKASTLGGVTPGRSDAFDIGLYIAFPFMILASLAFAFFPFIMDKIDVSSVGPPPTV